MIKIINGVSYKSMLDYGIRNLDKHCKILNELNVFPVPDGDTGTNMVMTMKNGYHEISGEISDLSEISRRFSNGVIFGARGNSGVIISQFFKGVAFVFRGKTEADAVCFSDALDAGVEFSYRAVANPVDGTILTVMRESAAAVKEKLSQMDSIDDVINTFITCAKVSLENTPNLLPVLKKAGVVDSGGAGLLYLFEGIKKYLDGEDIEIVSSETLVSQEIDYSSFGRSSKFVFGYCTELLIQLTDGSKTFEYGTFCKEISGFGDSLVVSEDDDKVKLHIHTRTPEQVLEFCHEYGEFLALKIENMSVQHTQKGKKYLYRESIAECDFGIVAVAPDPTVQEMFSRMGADLCILSYESPSSGEFIKAFEYLSAKEILVFPNSSNSILSAMQAASLYKNGSITVLNSRSVADCYASLAMIDFESDNIRAIVDSVNEILRNLYVVSVVRASKNVTFGKTTIVKNDFFALAGEDIISSGDGLEYVTLETIKSIVAKRDASIITVFYGKHVSEEQIEALSKKIESLVFGIEVFKIPTEDTIHDLILSFE